MYVCMCVYIYIYIYIYDSNNYNSNSRDNQVFSPRRGLGPPASGAAQDLAVNNSSC